MKKVVEVTHKDIGRVIRVMNPREGADPIPGTEDLFLVVGADHLGRLSFKHIEGTYRGCVIETLAINEDSHHIVWEGSLLTYAAILQQRFADACAFAQVEDSMEFVDKTSADWCLQGNTDLFYIEDSEIYSYDRASLVDSDENYHKYYVDNGCGDEYYVLFSVKNRKDTLDDDY